MGAQVVEIKEKRQRRPVSRVTVLTEKAAPGRGLATRWLLASPSSCKQVVPPFGLIVRSARSRSAFATLGPEIPLTTSRSASRRTSCWAERISALADAGGGRDPAENRRNSAGSDAGRNRSR